MRKLRFSGSKPRKVRKSRGIGVVPRESSYLHPTFAIFALSPGSDLLPGSHVQELFSHHHRLLSREFAWLQSNLFSLFRHRFQISHTWGLRLCADLLHSPPSLTAPPNGNTLLKPASISPSKWRFRKAQKPADGHTAEARLRPSSLVTNPHLSPPMIMFP